MVDEINVSSTPPEMVNLPELVVRQDTAETTKRVCIAAWGKREF